MALFASTELGSFEWANGDPAFRRSTGFGRRWFCRDCGTQLAMQVDYDPDGIDVSVMALDNPGLIAPEFHIWRDSAQAWSYPLDSPPHDPRERPGTRPGLPAR